MTPTSTKRKQRSTEAVFTGEVFAAVQTREEESCSPSHSLYQACVNSYREGGERDEREGYRGIQLLSAPGRLFCSLVLGTGFTRSPRATLLALYSAFQHFLAVERRNGSQQQQQRRRQHKECILVRSRGCTDIHMLHNTHTYTESSSVALWHAFGITAVVLSERGG